MKVKQVYAIPCAYENVILCVLKTSSGDEFGFDRENSLFLKQNSLFRRNNSLFYCVGNFAAKPLNLLACQLSKSHEAGGFDEIPC